MALLTLNTLNNVLVNPTFVGVSPAGDLVPNAMGDSFVYFKNTSASPVVATITATVACDQGTLHTLAATIPATDEVIVPLISRYNNTSGQVAITYDAPGTTAATGTLTFSGVVADAETVTIGTRVYEFDTAAVSTITAGHVRVDVSAAQTASAAVTALVTAITGDVSAVVTAVDGDLDTVVVTAKTTYSGAAGNLIPTTKTCTNAAWGGATLASGADTLTLAVFRNSR